jgi:hypothetical protein
MKSKALKYAVLYQQKLISDNETVSFQIAIKIIIGQFYLTYNNN